MNIDHNNKGSDNSAYVVVPCTNKLSGEFKHSVSKCNVTTCHNTQDLINPFH